MIEGAKLEEIHQRLSEMDEFSSLRIKCDSWRGERVIDRLHWLAQTQAGL